MRPSIEPLFLAQLIDRAPGRVRKRFDSEPRVAESWIWTYSENSCSVAANDETVEFKNILTGIKSLEDVSCSCLMTPKCFHILACCNCLPLVQRSMIVDEPTHQSNIPEVQTAIEFERDNDASTIAVTEAMRTSVSMLQDAIASLLSIGARRAGSLVHSGLLRSAHACRTADLYALGNTTLRIAENTRQFRQQSDEANSHTLKEDIAAALLSCRLLMQKTNVPRWVVGQTRRTFVGTDIRNLRGVLAEPIWTQSGFAGVSVYLQDPKSGAVYTINDMRPGDSSLIHQAYRGGIEVGASIYEARFLCRNSFAVQNCTVSEDCRLGKGKSTRWAASKHETSEPFSTGRFSLPIPEQLDAVFYWQETPIDQRPAGWDLVAINAKLLGSTGNVLVVQVEDQTRAWRLGIAIDNPHLEYRHNLELLARCPNLSLRCIVRIDVVAPYSGTLLAIANTDCQDNTPHLDLPHDWHGLCNLGLDRLERHYVKGIQPNANELEFDLDFHSVGECSKYISPIERRLIGMVLGGYDSIPSIHSNTHQRDNRHLRKLFLPTAASLLDLLTINTHSVANQGVYASSSDAIASQQITDAFLACQTYLQTHLSSSSKQEWKMM